MKPALRIQDWLRASAALHPLVVAVEGERERLTFAGLEDLAGRIAGGLARAGARPGDRVLVLSRNRAELVALYFAAARAGCVLVPVNWRLRAPEVRYIVEHCAPSVCVAEEAFRETLAESTGDGCARFLLGPDHAGWRPFAELCSTPAGTDEAGDAVGPDTAVVQMYTSGTTGKPKGALLTHANVLAVTRGWLQDLHLAPRASRFLQVTPLFHVGGMLMVMSTVATGATLVLLPEFEPVAALEALARRGITHTLLVPAMIQWLLLEPSLAERSFPSLELVAYGAAPMPTAVLHRAFDVFGCAFLQGYGLTETGGVLLTLRPEDHRWPAGDAPPARLSSAGRALSGVEVRVVDAGGVDVAPGLVGEIIARGPNVSPGYHADPAATAAALRAGWFHTGDLATVDAEGFVYVVDRLTDMILVGGENVYPREVEDVLMDHPEVADAAVIGVPHDVFGEEVLALIVPRAPLAGPDPRAVVRHCRTRLAAFKCPTRVELVPSLPRNAAGKLQRRALREPHWKGRPRRV